jgi:uncharacterized protein YbaR (Trm112 family)
MKAQPKIDQAPTLSGVLSQVRLRNPELKLGQMVFQHLRPVTRIRDFVERHPSEACPYCHRPLWAIQKRITRAVGRVVRIESDPTGAGDERFQNAIIDPIPRGVTALRCRRCQIWFFARTRDLNRRLRERVAQ